MENYKEIGLSVVDRKYFFCKLSNNTITQIIITGVVCDSPLYKDSI